MKLGFSGVPVSTPEEDELIDAKNNAKNADSTSFEAASASLGHTTDQDTEGDERTSSIWDHVFVDEGNDVSTIDDPSFLSEETSDWGDRGYGSAFFSASSDSSSDERDATTATSFYTSSEYDTYECCGGGTKEADDSDSSESFDGNDLHQDLSADLEEDQTIDMYTVSTVGQSTVQTPADGNDTLSSAQTEYRVGNTNLLWDEERLEVETQQLSRDEVLIRVASQSNIETEETIDGSTILSSNTDDKQSSLLRNIFFKRTLVQGTQFGKAGRSRSAPNVFGNKKEPDQVSGDRPVEKSSIRDDKNVHEEEIPKKDDIATSKDIVALGGVGLLLASILSTNKTDVNKTLTQEAASERQGMASPSRDIESPSPSLQKSEKVQGVLEPSLGAQGTRFGTNHWNIFMAAPQHRADEANHAEISSDMMNTLEEPPQCRSPSQTKRIGQRIEQAKAKSEARRNLQKNKQLQAQALDRNTKTKRKKKEDNNHKNRYSSLPAQQLPRSTSRTSLRYVPSPMCASIDVIDTLFGDAWESQPPRHKKQLHRTTSKNGKQKSREIQSKNSQHRRSSHRRRPSLKIPLCGAGIAFQTDRAMGKRSHSRQHLSHSKMSKGKDLKVQSLSRRPDNRIPRGRSRSLSRVSAPPLCGAAIPFSLIDDEVDKRRLQRQSRNSSTGSRRVAADGKSGYPRPEESDYKKRTSSQPKSSWSMRFLGKRHDITLNKDCRPIPGTLPTSKTEAKV